MGNLILSRARSSAIVFILPMRFLCPQAVPDRSGELSLRLGSCGARIPHMNDNVPPRRNEFGQPIGFDMSGWRAPPFPPRELMPGRYCRLEPLDADRHARSLYDAQAEDRAGSTWTYLFQGPYADFAQFDGWCRGAQALHDKVFYAIMDRATDRALGFASYMRIEPAHGVLEIGNIYYAPRLARTRAATEAMYLFAARAFALGYRRYEWKCDSGNLPSRAAATRLGFTYEGLFRQAIVNKGRNRDTTWFSIIDADWNGGLKDAYLRWLDPANFDAQGTQRLRLSALTAPYVHATS